MNLVSQCVHEANFWRNQTFSTYYITKVAKNTNKIVINWANPGLVGVSFAIFMRKWEKKLTSYLFCRGTSVCLPILGYAGTNTHFCWQKWWQFIHKYVVTSPLRVGQADRQRPSMKSVVPISEARLVGEGVPSGIKWDLDQYIWGFSFFSH
jgi:hypothetical protein